MDGGADLVHQARGDVGEAVVVTGNQKSFGAGANLKEIRAAQLSGTSDEYVGSGHDAFGVLAEMDVPTFSLITGVALGGGLELALHTAAVF